MAFWIYPAIDLQEGRCVRLVQGDFSRSTVFFENPMEAAIRWKEMGAKRLHVVDLDGAREGRAVNREIAVRIAVETGLPVQLGGGIRKREDLEECLGSGIRWVVLGTGALEAPDFLIKAIKDYPDRVLVGLDLRENRIAVEGWTREAEKDIGELLRLWKRAGVKRIVLTDIARDGTMQGYAGSERLLKVARAGFEVIASGGVTSMQDLRSLRDLSSQGVIGAIIGRALYDGRIGLSEAMSVEED